MKKKINKTFSWQSISGYYVYRHIIKDTNEIIYVGKGKRYRATDSSNRNIYWNNIFNKYELYAEIIKDSLFEQEALNLEVLEIQKYKEIGLCRANITIGGEGVSGLPCSEEKKQLLREAHKKGKFKHTYFKKGHEAFNDGSKLIGKKQSEEHKQKVSKALKGKKKPKGFGKNLSNKLKGVSNTKLMKKLKVTYPDNTIKYFNSKKEFVEYCGHRFQVIGKKIEKGIFKGYIFEYL